MDFLDQAVAALVAGLDCRLAGIARPGPGETVETLVLRGPRRRRKEQRYRLESTPCAGLYRSGAGRRHLYLEDCRAGGLLPPPFARRLGPLAYRAETILDGRGRAVAHVFALMEAGRPDCAEHRGFFRLVAQRAGAEYLRLRAEQARQEIEARFRDLIEGSAEGVLIHRDQKPLFVNESFLRLFGFDSIEQALALDGIEALVAPEERAPLARHAAGRLRGEPTPELHEFRALRRDGQAIWLSTLVRSVDWQGVPATQCSLTDITARKQAEAEQSQLAAIVDSANNAIIGRRLDGTIFSWNAAAERLYGFSAGEAIGRPITLLHPEGREDEAAAAAAEVCREDGIVEREFLRRHKDGRVIPVLASLSPVRDAEGRIVGLSSISRDRSRHKQMERDLQRSEALLRHAQRLGRIGWWTWRADDRRIALSAEACRVLGLKPGESLTPSLGSYIERFVHDEDREDVAAAMSELAPGAPAASCRHRTLHANGRVRVVHLWCEAVYDAAGEMASVNGIVQDVTALVRYREALEFSEARFRDVTEVASDWVWETDAEGRFEYVSDRIRSITGFAPEHYLGQAWPDCVADWYSGESNMLIAEMEAGHPFRDVRLRILTRDDRDSWVAVSGRPRLDADGRFVGYRGAVSDRTARVSAEAALREAKEQAESANDMKSRFLAAASHDLRQPLHALRLLVAVLGTTEEPAKQASLTEEIAGGLTSMTSILNALLDVSELDAGGVRPEIAAFSLEELFRGVTMTVAARAAEKGLRFVSLPSRLRVRSDPALLARIVENFLVNAAQYTARGRILLGCRRRGDRVRIEVWDSGHGIPPDRLDDIFEEFHQLEKRNDDREKGLGLGLAIVRRLAALLDHRIDVRSLPDKGSMFAVEVPLAEAGPAGAVEPAAAPLREPALDLSGRLVLLIENGPKVRDATERLLEGWGARVVTATGAQHALQRAAALRRPPDLIIADLQLSPGLDGVAAIDAVGGHFGRPVPAMILTGEPSSARLRELRCQGLPVLRKPASAESIRAAVIDLMQSRLAAQ